MKLKLFFYLCMLPFLCLAQETQPQQFSNRYGMKMKQNEDGSYSLLYAKKYAKFIDVNTIPDVMTPYTYQANRLKSKDYKGVITKDIVYKKYKDYELIPVSYTHLRAHETGRNLRFSPGFFTRRHITVSYTHLTLPTICSV